MKSESVAIQIKATEQYFPWPAHYDLQVILIFEFADEYLKKIITEIECVLCISSMCMNTTKSMVHMLIDTSYDMCSEVSLMRVVPQPAIFYFPSTVSEKIEGHQLVAHFEWHVMYKVIFLAYQITLSEKKKLNRNNK